MNRFRTKTNSPGGFTLIETIVYIAIFCVFVGGLFSFVGIINSNRIHSQLTMEVNDQGSSAIRTITRIVRNARSITTPTAGTSSANLIVNTGMAATNPTTFSVTDGVLYMTEGVQPTVALTNNRVKVSNNLFTNLSRPTTPGTVQIRINLSNATDSPRPENHYSLDFYGSATIR